jgi:hypothetical protein
VGMQEAVRYTFAEALRLNHQSGHYGPWVEEWRALCGGNRQWESSTPQPS